MKKKSLTLIATTALVASTMIVPTASAQYLEGQPIEDTEGLEYKTTINEDLVNEPISDEEVVQPANFIEVKGTIHEITEDSNGYFYGTVEGDQPFAIYFNEQTVILNNVGEKIELEEGMEFTAFVDSSKPMIMIYPPRYSPEVIIVQTKELGTVQYDQFDENFLNKNKDLSINVDEDTDILNLSGTKLSKEDIVNEDVLVFYTVTTKSLPAQTAPSQVIVLSYDEVDQVEEGTVKEENNNIEMAYQIAERDSHLVNGVKMIPLRLVAEQLGYKVNSTGNGAIVSKGALSFTITRGSKMYGYNKAVKSFAEVPTLLEKNKTYVPYEFLELLIGNGK
nr:stalk domain-containing protein [Lysinibacillus timonensis]